MNWTEKNATVHEKHWWVNRRGDRFPEGEPPSRERGGAICDLSVAVHVRDGGDTVVRISIEEGKHDGPLFRDGTHFVELKVHHPEKVLQGKRLAAALGHAEKAAAYLGKAYAELERLKELRPQSLWP